MAAVTACPADKELEEFLLGRLPADSQQRVEGHLTGCAHCLALLPSLKAEDTLVEAVREQATQPGERPEKGVVEGLVQRLQGLPPPAPPPAGDNAGARVTSKANEQEPVMITFPCAGCGKTLRVKEDLAGKKVRCPKCGQAVRIPGTPAAAGVAAGPPDGLPLPPEPGASPVPATEMATLSPPVPGAEGDAQTLPPEPAPDTTPEPVAIPPRAPADPPSELYDFLAPAQAVGELGRLGPYRVLKVLGAGGMGVVFQAEDPHLDRLVALKAMLPALAASESARRRFLREAKAAAAVEHDHVVPIFHVGEDRGVPFIAMPFLKGEPLDERLQREGRLSVPEVLRIGREIALGLAAAHKRGLIHRDIKPANVWLEAETGRVKILDFGLARAGGVESNLTQAGAIVGTPAYMAPEQAQGTAVDARCDLFSLGCVLYRLCSGEQPFRGTDTVSTLVAVATENPPPPTAINPEVPAQLSNLVMHLLAKKPEDRPESAQAVADALRDIEGHTAALTAPRAAKTRKGQGGVTPQMEGARTQPGGSAKKRLPIPWLVGGGVFGLALLAAGLVLFWQTPNGTVRIVSDDPSVEVVFDQTGPTINGADKEPITLRAGEHGVRIKRGDFTFEADKFALRKGETITLQLDWIKGTMQLVHDGGKVIRSQDFPPPNKAGGQVVGGLPTHFTNILGMKFVLVPKGKSWLGGGGGRPGNNEVEIADDFYLGTYEVTQEEWQKVMGSNPSQFKAVAGVTNEDQKRFPVEMVSWEDVQLFVAQVNKLDKQTGWVYRLPTQVEWEYACRGGPTADQAQSTFDFYVDKPTSQLSPKAANVRDSGLNRTCKVGSYPANRLGLYDMHGNVIEWCADVYAAWIKEPQAGSRRAIRGGSFVYSSESCRAASLQLRPASQRSHDLGLRLARVPAGKEPVPPPRLEEKKTTFANSFGMEFALVPKGKFWMSGHSGKLANSVVEFKDDFYLGVYEVTQEEWQKVMGKNPSSFSRMGIDKELIKDIPDADLKRFPVETISWQDAQEFVRLLNEKVKEAGWVYRLPKEAEWEYACRGGPMTDRADSAFDFYFDKPTDTLLPGQANFKHDKSLNRPCKVGSYPPNRLGLYDMHGNVSEWCEDELRNKEGASRPFFRGGGWSSDSEDCRAANRHTGSPSVRSHIRGLRLARVPAGKQSQREEPIKALRPKPSEGALPARVTNRLGIKFVLVPRGKSWLGGGGKVGTKEVEIPHDFYLGAYEVTQEEWEKVMGENPSAFTRTGRDKKLVKDIPDAHLKRFPVETIRWPDAQEFVRRLNDQVKEAGWVYRLPTAAEWEYACRGGPMTDRSESAFDFYLEKPTNELLPTQANYRHNKSLNRPCRVGSYLPNRLGLYDMHGNVGEWCEDEALTRDAASQHTLRGGDWSQDADACRAGDPHTNSPSVVHLNVRGLRLARVPAGTAGK